MEQRHYFLNTEHKPEDYFSFTTNFGGKTFVLESCADIFSKEKLDEGTRILLQTVFDKVLIEVGAKKARVLDLGCGVGVIGIILGTFFPSLQIDMLDINENAVMLSEKNVKNNKVKNVKSVFISNGFDNVSETYDYIITNPPIKAGKDNLFKLMMDSGKALNTNGKIILVVRKKHGEESLRRYLEELFGNCEILNRDKGFYILSSIKK